MIGLTLRWLAPVLLASVTLLRWGEDYQYSRFVLLLTAAAAGLLTRPRKAAPGLALLFLAAGPLLAAAAWAFDAFSIIGATPVAALTAAMLAIWAVAYDERPEDYAKAWIAAITAASFYGALQAFGALPSPVDAYGQSDPAATFGLSNFAAEALVLSIPLTAALLSRATAPFLQAALPVSAVIQIGYLFLTNARAGWLGLTAAFAVLLALWRPADMRLYKGLAVAAIVFVAGFAVIGGARLNLLSQNDPSLQFRREAWKAAAAMTADKPLTGFGPGKFASLVPQYASSELNKLSARVRRTVHHPHNEFLAAAAERGLPSLAWLLAGFAAAAAFFYRRKAVWGLAALAGTLVTAAAGFPFQQPAFWAGAAILFGIAAQDDAAPRVGLHVRAVAAVALLTLALGFGVRAAAADLSRQAVAKLEAVRRTRDRDRAESLRAQASEHLRNSLAIYPYDPEAIVNAASAASFPDQRVDLLKQYLTYIPGDTFARIAYSQAQLDAGDTQAAEATLRDLLQGKNPPSLAAHRLIGMLIDQRNYPQAAQTADDALKRWPGDAQILADAGDAYRLLGKHTQAAELYERALPLAEGEHGLYLRTGVAYFEGGDLERAAAAFAKGKSLAPKESVYSVYLARVALASNRKAEAKTNLLHALKYDPDLANNLRGSAPELLPLLKELN